MANSEDCTGITIEYEGDTAFETQVLVRAKAGNPPDIAYVPQPGLIKQLVATGSAVQAPNQTSANVDEFFGKDWKGYGTVDGKFYAAPLGANVKSLVWYSPKASEVQAFQTHLSTDTWANAKAKLSSGWVSANSGLDVSNLKSPIDKLSAQILLDPNAIFRFDGSDQMPAAVGSNAFWNQATDWIVGQETKTTLDNIEKAWPR